MTVKGFGHRAWTFMRRLFAEFLKDNGAMVAAAMSFYALLSIIPLLMIAVAGLAHVLQSSTEAYKSVFEYVARFSPSQGQEQGIRELLEGIVKGRSVAGGLGLLILLWSGSQIFVSLENAINIAWDVRQRRNFLMQRILAIAMMIGAGILLLISLGLTALVRIIQGYTVPGLRIRLSELHWLWSVAGFLLPLAITIAMFTLVYKILPNRRVKWRDAFVGGFVAGLLWEVAKQGFSFYLTRYAHYSAVYGSLASVIIMMVWIYYSSIVAVIGAEVGAVRAKLREGVEGELKVEC
ncbi:MAG: YihY/virulence factor BrkB family protein [Armatimonadota bacterium]|nr:YihY/virulence factor BrkB family protein [Armatimonadota bacterium]